MPELDEVLSATATVTDPSDKIVDVTTIDAKPEKKPTVAKKSVTKSTATKSTVTKPAHKPAEKKPVEEKSTTEKTATTEKKSETAAKPEATAETKPEIKTESTESAETTNEKILRRPPMEQITKDFSEYLATLEIAGQPLKKLEYKCGKIIFGLSIENSKDFRVIAFKARKKSKSVAGKSRCIFYFGLSENLNDILKAFPSTTTTEFGKCSVQVKKPIQLILDKTTYNDFFDQDVEKVMSTLKQLSTLTIEQKNEQWKSLQEKIKKQSSDKTSSNTSQSAGEE